MSPIPAAAPAPLAPQHVMRAPTPDDAPAIADLIAMYDMVHIGEVIFDLSDVLSDWESPTFDLALDARVIATTDGLIVGYETVYRVLPNGQITTDGYVHPACVGQGLGTHLLNWAESRAREHASTFPPEQSVQLQAGFPGNDLHAHSLLKSLGYATTRHYWGMEIRLNEEPAFPVWPEGISVRTFDPERDDHQVWYAVTEAFQDHWGLVPASFEEWVADKPADLDPTLWFLAVAGDEVVGVSLCKTRLNQGWISDLGVRSAWRGAGLGMALLKHSFREFYHRGQTRIGLRVDAQNVTGATRLYEKAGMYVAHRFDIYSKEIRAGRPAQS